MAHVAVLGGGIGGLGIALGLARRGHTATVIERDLPPPTVSGDAAFDHWERRSVAQFRQAHGFSSRARTLLLEHAPGVLDRLAEDGIESSNFFTMLTPPEMHRPEDEAFTGFQARRAAFELAMRLEADATTGITMLSPAVVADVVVAEGSSPLRVIGVRLDGGHEIAADVVVDAGGRRSPVATWLAHHGATFDEIEQPCGVTYVTRYFRRNPAAGLPLFAVLAARTTLDRLNVLGFVGDRDTYAITLVGPTWDEELRDLRHEWAWDAAVRTVPSAAAWIDPAFGSPITGVMSMTGHRNFRRRIATGGEPAVLGLLPVGDALCTTNPENGWGASIALITAFAAADAIDAGLDDLAALALRYEREVDAAVDCAYAASANVDRIRDYQWRGLQVPEHERDEEQRQELLEKIREGMLRDPVLGRAFLRRVNFVGAPDDLFHDDEVRERAEALSARAAQKARNPKPTRDDIVEAMRSARPTATAPS